MKRSVFLIWKRAIFGQIKEIKHLSGGVVLYAAQTNALIDAELVKRAVSGQKLFIILNSVELPSERFILPGHDQHVTRARFFRRLGDL